MVQTALPIKNKKSSGNRSESAKAVGLSCTDDVVTLQFLSDASAWGQPLRQIRLDRKVAEELSRLLNDELEYEWKWD
jgi:hypothetical protein